MIIGDLIIDVWPGLQKIFPCLSRSYESVITCHEISSSANHVSLGPLSLHPALLHFVDDHCLASTCHAMSLLSCSVYNSHNSICTKNQIYANIQTVSLYCFLFYGWSAGKMKRILHSQRATLILPALDFPQVKNLFWPDNKSFIDHACSVKVAEYWSLFSVFYGPPVNHNRAIFASRLVNNSCQFSALLC